MAKSNARHAQRCYSAAVTDNPFAQALAEEPDYVPVYASSITPESFTFDKGLWRVSAFGPDGKLTDYEISVAGGMAAIVVDDEWLPTEDIHSHLDTDMDIIGLYDYLSFYDGKERLNRRCAQPWAGDDVESMLNRAQHNVVAMEERDINIGNFLHPEYLAEHLGEVLAGTPLEVRVEPITKWSINDRTLMRLIRHGEEDLYSSFFFFVGVDHEEWIEVEIGENNQGLHVRFDGTELMDLEAFGACRLSELPKRVGLAGRGFHSWWLLSFPTLDVGFVVPSHGVMLKIKVDDDGQSVEIRAFPEGERTRHNALVDAFTRRWGHLIDPTVEHSDADLDAVINALLEDPEVKETYVG